MDGHLQVACPGFSCCDWVPHKSLQGDERLLQRVAYTQGPSVVQFLRDREQFAKLTSFPGSLYSHLSPQLARPYFQVTIPQLSPPTSPSASPSPNQSLSTSLSASTASTGTQRTCA